MDNDRMLRPLAAFVLGIFFAGVIPLPSSAQSLPEIISANGQYIVVYKSDISRPDDYTRELRNHYKSLNLELSYAASFQGFAADIKDERDVRALQADPNISYITPNFTVNAYDLKANRLAAGESLRKLSEKKVSEQAKSTQWTFPWWRYPIYRPPTRTPLPIYPWPIYPIPTPKPTPIPLPQPVPAPTPTPQPIPAPAPQPVPGQPVQPTPLGVKRIGTSSEGHTGAGVSVAVLDTGIDFNHPDLTGSILGPGKNCVGGASPQDDNGHGTHVAGTIAAANNAIGVVGVASGAKIVPIKVLKSDGSGDWSSIICGIDWMTANAATYNIKAANMSLGGSGMGNDNNCGRSNNDALHQAICRARDAGITFVVAAGNDGANASAESPANYKDAVITVSALADSDGAQGGRGAATSQGADDTFAAFSNYGSIVDIGAPGVQIYSTKLGGGYTYMSGTSMASPHAAGAAALYLQTHPAARLEEVRGAFISSGELLNQGHTDLSGRHQEPVLRVTSL